MREGEAGIEKTSKVLAPSEPPLGARCGPGGPRSLCCAASTRRLLRASAVSFQRLFWKRSHPTGSSFLQQHIQQMVTKPFTHVLDTGSYTQVGTSTLRA